MGKIEYNIKRLQLSLTDTATKLYDDIYTIVDKTMETLTMSNLEVAQYIMDRFENIQYCDHVECLVWFDHDMPERVWHFDIYPELFKQLKNTKEIARELKKKFQFIDYKDDEYDATNIVTEDLIKRLTVSEFPYDVILNIALYRNEVCIYTVNVPLWHIQNDIVNYVGEHFLMPPYGQTSQIEENDVIKYNIYNTTPEKLKLGFTGFHILGRCVITKKHIQDYYKKNPVEFLNEGENTMTIEYKVVRRTDKNVDDIVFEITDRSMETLNKGPIVILEYIYNKYNEIQIGDVINKQLPTLGSCMNTTDKKIAVTADLYFQLMDKLGEKLASVTENDKLWDKIKRSYYYTDDKYKNGKDDKSYTISKNLLCELMKSKDVYKKTKIQIWASRNNEQYYGESDINLLDIKNDIVAYVAKTILIKKLSKFDKLEEGDMITYAISNIIKTEPLGVGYNGSMEYNQIIPYIYLRDTCIVSAEHVKRVYPTTKKDHLIMPGITDPKNYKITKCKKVVNGKEVGYDDVPPFPQLIIKEECSGKREDYISWNEYFMGTAILAGYRSKDPGTQVGACIVDSDNKIVSIGYNGFPKNCSDDSFPWRRKADNEYDTKYMYVVHAELNAILNAGGRLLKDTTIFVTLFPCNECAKAIIQSGIKKIVYQSDKYADTISTKASKRMLEAAGVEIEHLPLSNKSITITI